MHPAHEAAHLTFSGKILGILVTSVFHFNTFRTISGGSFPGFSLMSTQLNGNNSINYTHSYKKTCNVKLPNTGKENKQKQTMLSFPTIVRRSNQCCMKNCLASC